MPAKAVKKKNLSAIKRGRQAKKRNLSNSAVRSRIKTLSKKTEEAVTMGNKENMEQLLKEAMKIIQSAVLKGILHKNTAARKISQLARLVNTILKAAAA